MITIECPEFLKDDPGWSAFYNQINVNYTYYLAKIRDLRNLVSPEQTDYPAELGYLVGAYISPHDSSDLIRKKAQGAIYLHKNLSNFTLGWKPYIDRVCGFSSSIYTGLLASREFRVGRSFIGGGDKIGSSAHEAVARNIGDVYIDCGTSLTPSQMTLLRDYFTPLRPVYFNVYLGYANIVSTSAFVVGSSLIGGAYTIGGASSIANFDIYLKL